MDMNQMIPGEERDIRLKEKIKAEADYAIHMAVIALKDVYERGELIESEHSKNVSGNCEGRSDSVCAFLDEKLVQAEGKRMKRSEVYRCMRNTVKTMTARDMENQDFSKAWRAKDIR